MWVIQHMLPGLASTDEWPVRKASLTATATYPTKWHWLLSARLLLLLLLLLPAAALIPPPVLGTSSSDSNHIKLPFVVDWCQVLC